MSGNFRRDVFNARSSTQPPWATDDTPTNSNSNNNVSNTNPPWGLYTTDISGAGGNVRNNPAASGDAGVATRTGGGGNNTRGNRPTIRDVYYALRREERPYDRDLPYWNFLFPFLAPHGTDSHRDRERIRREEKERNDRREKNEAEANTVVSEAVPLKNNILTVKNVNLHIPENTKEHKTSDYDCTEREKDPRLVVRRGQVFIMTVTFQRFWSSKDDDLYLKFSVGEKPSEESKSLVMFQLTEEDSARYKQEGHWGAKIVKKDGKNLTISVYIAPDAIVGEWECSVTTGLVGWKERYVYDAVDDIYVVFNPWCKDDQVCYKQNVKDLDEYVLNEYGCVFMGQSDYISRMPWVYGQFQDGILDICMTILRMAFEMEVTPDMGDAIMVTRKLSRILNNSPQDPGIMTGNWSGNFGDGTEPTTWRGSVQILTEYARTQKSVKYAQCWVFSHVLTTVLRALGIPSRSLTNFDSAHDTDKTVTIDYYRDENGEDLPELKSDSIWNFHCWNDVWINRPDLDGTNSSRSSSARGSYSGWHAVDSTPQEHSEGRYQCGPTPHKAIKNGELSVGYDTSFLYGEVNGEVCTWLVTKDNPKDMKLLSRDPMRVGKKISTKVPDGKPAGGVYTPNSRFVHDKRQDITENYKYPEGSREERDSFRLAVGKELGAKIFEKPGGINVEIIKLPATMVGNNFTFSAIFTNNSKEKRKLSINLSIFPVDYRGKRLGRDKIAALWKEDVVLLPGKREIFETPVLEKAYLALCDNSLSMELRASANIEGEDKPITREQKYVLSVPQIMVQVVGGTTKIRRLVPFTVSVIIKNPSSRPLTDCVLQFTGTIQPLDSQGFSSVDGGYILKLKDLFPNQELTRNFEVSAQVSPWANNLRELDVDLISTQLPNMTGTLDISVE